MRLKKTYSSREVAAITALSARQLQLWDAGGLLSPAIPSHKTAAGGYTERRYTPIELFELLVLADLRKRGFSVYELHAILRILRERFAADRRSRHLRANGDRSILQPAEVARSADAGRRERRGAEGTEWQAKGQQSTVNSRRSTVKRHKAQTKGHK
jgi:DNA-binding transcriptional MerR regulator